MLKWPAKARRSLAAFFVKWNDFDVFVEDTAKFADTIYSTFIGRIVADRCVVSNVFPLGDRKNVLDAVEADISAGGRNRIYLVDGDLDLIANLQAPVFPRLYVHQLYHVENYFICENALVTVLHEENPRFSVDDVKIKLDFAGWLNEVHELLYVFAVFGLTKILDPSLPTIKLGIGTFTTDRKLDKQKIQQFCSSRVSDLEARFSKEEFDTAKAAVDSAISQRQDFSSFISAREYLIPVLRWWIASKGLQLPAGKESLLFRLSKTCSLERHPQLVQAVVACATGAQ